MRTLQLAGSFLAFAAAFAAYGCVLDVSGLETTASNAGGASPTSSTIAGPGATSTGGSAASTTSAGCIPTAEDCENGQDEDCDGLIDCADPDCTGPTDGRECVALAPAGWTLVAFTLGDVATCPAGYGDLVKVVEAPISGSHCACACSCPGIQNNPCVHGTLTAVIGNTCTAVNVAVNVTGGCDPLGVTLGNYNSIKAKPLAVTPIDVAVDGTLPGVQLGSSGVTCLPSPSDAGGCSGGQACLPKTTSASLCIQSPGEVDCPAGPLTKRTVIGSGSMDDQRSCAACTCSSSAASCSNPTFAGYTADDCSSNTAAAVIDNTCHQPPSGDWKNADRFIYSATPNAPTCALKGPAPDVIGSIKLQDARTICCSP